MASPDFMQLLRLKNIFQPPMGNDLPEQGGIFGSTPPPPPLFNPAPMDVQAPGTSLSQPMAASPGDRIAQEMARLYTPETEMTDKFNQMVGNIPSQADYKPSMLRRIGGALTAVGGGFDGKGGFRFNPQSVEAGMNLMNEPLNKNLADFKTKIGPAYQAASLEKQNNVNERTMAYQTISQQLRAEADNERANNNERNAQIRENRAKIYEFKARNPGKKFNFSGPTVMMTDPATGEVSDTGVPTGHMSQADKMTIEQENAIARIEATGGQQRQTEGVRQTGREGLAETRGWKIYNVPDGQGGQKAVQINEVTGETKDVTSGPAKTPVGAVNKPGGGSSGKTELPTQTKVRQYNSARELVNTRPEFSKFIRLGPGANEFRITQPSTNFWGSPTGPTAEQVAEIETAIYGMPVSAIGQPTRTGAPTGTTTAGPQNTPTGTPAIRPPVTNSGPTGTPKDTGAKYTPPNMPAGNILIKTQTNKTTGEKRKLRSIDGGKTWEIMP